MGATVGAELGRVLAAAGVEATFGAPLPGVGHVAVADPEDAVALADAWGAASGTVGVAVLAGEPTLLHLGSRPGARVHHPIVATDGEELIALVSRALCEWRPVSTAVAIHLDLDAPADASASAHPAERDDRPAGPLDSEVVDQLRDPTARVAVVAGPGVVRSGSVALMRDAARAWSVGVVNTWGAKGLFGWDDPAHHGTAGLQARDFDLADLAECDLVVGVGIDPAESPRYRWALGASAAEIEPGVLGAAVVATGSIERPRTGPPRLYRELAAALGPHYRGQVPGSPATAVLGAKARWSAGELEVVCAGPGLAGLWLARTFPTERPGSVIVPAVAGEGFAVAAALAGAAMGRRVLAVVDEIGAPERRLLTDAHERGLRLSVEVWSGTETGFEPEAVAGHDVRWVGVDPACTEDLVAVAGPVVAWT